VSSRVTMRLLLRRNKTLLNFAKQVVGHYEAFRDSRLSEEDRWARRSGDELSFWADSLRAGLFTDRFDPNREVNAACLRRALAEIPATKISILDVGAGPLTAVGHVFPGKEISVVATDPLADRYMEIMRSCGVTPLVVPIPCSGEELRTQLAGQRFDVAYCQNALDHSNDPMMILENMLGLITPTGRVALNHFRNVGEHNGYMGLHFWNIDLQNGSLVFWNRETKNDVSALLVAGGFETDCWLESGEYGEKVHCLIRPTS
jgi:SAM-dependent methyltransferase